MYPPVQLVEGVSLTGLEKPLLTALHVAKEIFDDYGVDCVVTSANDGAHKSGSLHYLGLAFDLRTRHLKPQYVSLIYVKLQRALKEYRDLDGMKGRFDVVLESNHLHIEFDRRLNK